MANPIIATTALGQSIWFDNIQRDMLENGELERMIREDGLRGITSNPTIFQKAMTTSASYDEGIAALLRGGTSYSARDVFYNLAIEDIQAAADHFFPIYQESGGRDGMVSIEVSPELAHDTAGTISEARFLHKRVARPNVMIKVPGTEAGLPAIEALIADGINVNVTLLFSVERYRQVVESYLRGLEARAQRRQRLGHVASVASFFVSRVDSAVDKLLDERSKSMTGEQRATALALQGKTAIANAKLAYAVFKEVFESPRFAKLHPLGAQPQRLLWASTGTKNPKYRDVIYIDELIGPDTVNTVPPATYNAFKDHGRAIATLEQGLDDAKAVISALKDFQIDLAQVTRDLEAEGVKLFADSFKDLLSAIDSKLAQFPRKRSANG